MSCKHVGHLDADCFYVSCERVRFPILRRQAVGVLGNQGACVIAKSYELKAKGVKTRMPIWDDVKLCPEGIFAKRDFHWYEVISRRLLAILQQVSPQVEYYSIDEMFFESDSLPDVFKMPLPQAVKALQQRVLDELNIPVSIGVSRSKTLAKLCSDTAKPFGTRVLCDDESIQAFLPTQPVEELSGVAERSRRKLAAHGIITCADFAQAPRPWIRKLLTVKGETLWWELHGEAVQPILAQRPAHKCLGRGGSLGGATADRLRLQGWLTRNVERLVEELDFHQVLVQRLAFGLEYQQGGSWSMRARLPEDSASFDVLIFAGQELLDQAPLPGPVSHMFILADRLAPRRAVQNSFLADPVPLQKPIANLKREVNQRLGRFAIRSGQTLHLPDIYADHTQDYDICDIRGKICF